LKGSKRNIDHFDVMTEIFLRVAGKSCFNTSLLTSIQSVAINNKSMNHFYWE
jgi:hypothetical protein